MDRFDRSKVGEKHYDESSIQSAKGVVWMPVCVSISLGALSRRMDTKKAFATTTTTTTTTVTEKDIKTGHSIYTKRSFAGLFPLRLRHITTTDETLTAAARQ